MKILRLETKIFIICGIVAASLIGVNAITVNWGVDPSDSQAYAGYDTAMVTNTNGKAWTANSAGIQAAIWDLNGTTGTVYLPGGTITLTDPILYYENTVLIGAGKNVTKLDSSAITTDYAIKPGSTTKFMRGVQMSDFKISGGTDLSRTGKHGLLIQNTWEGTITRIQIEYMAETCIVLDGHNHAIGGMYFEDCTFQWSKNACNITSTGTGYVNLNIFLNCDFTGCTDNGVNMPGVNGIAMRHNAFKNCHFEVVDYGIIIGTAAGSQCYYTRLIQPYFDTCYIKDLEAGDGALYTQMEGGLKHNWKITSTKSLSHQVAKTNVYTVAPNGTSYFADFYCSGANDQIEINYALGLLTGNGGVCKLMPGTFVINGSITPSAGDTLEGDGMKSTIISSTTDNLDLITIASSNVTLKDFHLKGTTAGTGTDLLIYLQTGCKHFRAERVRATDTLEEAFYIYDADYSQLVDCEAYSVRTGVSISSSDYIQIWGGSYHDCSSPNLYVVNSEYTMINGVSCYNGANYNARFSTSGNMTIANCMFKDGASSGIFVDASRNSSFTGCFFLDNADNGALVNGNSGNTGFNTFIGCHFKGNTGDGIELGGVTVPVATVIDGCSFINNGANINDGGAGTITGDNALG